MRISMRESWKRLPLCCLILLAGCTTQPQPRTAGTTAAEALKTVPIIKTARTAGLPLPTLQQLVDRQLAEDDALLIGAGDIADCGAQLQHAKDTAAIIARFPTAKVFAAGDDAYTNGTTQEFRDCYDKSWGGFKDRTWPAPGNHDYGIYMFPRRNNAAPYFAYFGTNAGPSGLGYYSHDLGGWHIVSLNSMAGQSASSMTAQVTWLKGDLEKNQKRCTLAYWHHPLFSSGDQHGDQTGDLGRSMGPLWEVLLKHDAEVIVNGHDHHYEWFKPQDANANDTAQGIRQFIVGTGGGEKRGIGTVKKNSEVRLPQVYGVLLLTLHPNSYEWHFINADGTVEDGSSAPNECH
jgi:hypothetical protein